MCRRSVFRELTLIVVLAGCDDDRASRNDAGADDVTDAVASDTDASVAADDAGGPPPTAAPYPTPTNCASPPHPVACGWGSDQDMDGELDDREESIFDDQGRLVGIKHYSEDDLQQTDVFVYDGDELVEHEVHNGDDVVTWRMTFDYDNGWLVEQTRDEGDDGSVEIRQTYERDEVGNLIEWTIERADLNDSRYTFLYPEGRLEEVELDNEPYGSIDVTDTYSYFDDGRVRMVALIGLTGRTTRAET